MADREVAIATQEIQPHLHGDGETLQFTVTMPLHINYIKGKRGGQICTPSFQLSLGNVFENRDPCYNLDNGFSESKFLISLKTNKLELLL